MQMMGDLAESRVEPSALFTLVSLDCFGTFLFKGGGEGPTPCKRYGLLITCLCCRAIHLEMLEDLSANSFINGVECFLAIRGLVQEIRFDQGTNFVGAASDFSRALLEMKQALEGFSSKMGFKFIFNPPNASHVGRIWEWQIHSARAILNHTVPLCWTSLG